MLVVRVDEWENCSWEAWELGCCRFGSFFPFTSSLFFLFVLLSLRRIFWADQRDRLLEWMI